MNTSNKSPFHFYFLHTNLNNADIDQLAENVTEEIANMSVIEFEAQRVSEEHEGKIAR